MLNSTHVKGHILATVCVISHMGHWDDGSEPDRKKGGKEGGKDRKIQKVWEKQREGDMEHSRQ